MQGNNESAHISFDDLHTVNHHSSRLHEASGSICVLVHARQHSFSLVCAHLCSPAPVCAHSYLPVVACAQIPALVPAGKPSMGVAGAGLGLRLSYLQSNLYPQCGYWFLPGMGMGMATDTWGFTPAVP